MVEYLDGPVRPSSPEEARQYLSRIRETEREKEEESPEAARDELRGLRTMATETLDNPSHVLPELLQNADDVGGSCTRVTVEVTDKALVFRNHNEPMGFEDVEALGEFTKSTKRGNLELIGHFGIGFKTVFSLTDTPYIHSGYFSFQYSDKNPTIPLSIEYEEQPSTNSEYFDGTTIVLPFTDEAKQNRVGILEDQVDELASMMPFLNNITTIEVDCDGQQQVYRREKTEYGGIKVIQESGGKETLVDRIRLFSESFSPDDDLLKQLAERRHLDVAALQQRKPELEITIGIPVDDTGAPRSRSGKPNESLLGSDSNGSGDKQGRYESHLFCHFPTEPDTRLPFDIQADFSLKPDRKTIAWPDDFNRKLLDRVPSVFQKAFAQFHQEMVDPSRVLELIPDPNGERPVYVDSMVEQIISFIKTESCVPDRNGDLFQPVEVVFLRQPFRELLTESEISGLLDRQVRYPSEKISKEALSRLRSIVSESVVSVGKLLAMVDKSIVESRNETWLIRFLAGIKRYWNSKYEGSGGILFDSDRRKKRTKLLNKIKSAPLLPLDGGGVTSYTAVDGEIYRLSKAYADDYELFRGTDRLNLLSEEFLSAIDDPEEDFEQQTKLAGELLFNRATLAIPTLEATNIVEKVINPAFESGSIDPDRADQYVLFVSRRPKSLAEEAKIKLQSRGTDDDVYAPEALYLGKEYIHAYDSETVFEPFSRLHPISDHYIELDERSKEEWVESFAALGVKRRIEVAEQDPWESDRFTSQEAAREFLNRHGDQGQTEIHDERVLNGYNGKSSQWRWMKREHRRGALKKYKYAFIDRHLPEQTKEILENLADESDPDDEFWTEFLKMIDAGWEEYYQNNSYRVYKYSKYGKKYRVNGGDCACPSSFGLFLQNTVWCPGSNGKIHQPTDLFVRNDHTKSKPVIFVDPEPNSLELIDFLGFQQYPGIQVTVSTIQEIVTEYRNKLESSEIDPREVQMSIRRELWGISQELADEGSSDSRELDALIRLKELPFVYVENTEPAFRTPSEVTWEGPSLGEYRVPISDSYADFESLLVNELGVNREPTLEDCISFLGTTTLVSESDGDGVTWTEIETAWRRVLQDSVYISQDRVDNEADRLADTVELLKTESKVPTAAETLKEWGDVQYHTTDVTLLTNPPTEIQQLTLAPIRDERYKTEEYLERLEQLTGTKPLDKTLNRTILTEIDSVDRVGILRSVYPQILDTAYSYFVSIGAKESEETLRELAETPVYKVDVLSCRYTLDNQYETTTDDVRCLIDSTVEKRIIIAAKDRSEFSLIEFLVQEFQLNKTEQKKLIALLKGALGKPDDLIRAYLEDDDYEYHQLPPSSDSSCEDSDVEQTDTAQKQPTDDLAEDNSSTTTGDEQREVSTEGEAPSTSADRDTPEETADSADGTSEEGPKRTTAVTGQDEEREDSLEDIIEGEASTSEGIVGNGASSNVEEEPDYVSGSTSSQETPDTTGEGESVDTLDREEREDDHSSSSEEPEGLAGLIINGGHSGGGGGGAEQPEIGAKGEEFVFDRLRETVETHFKTVGRLLDSQKTTEKKCVIRGETDGIEHKVQITDVSQYNRGYDILLSGMDLANDSVNLSVDGLREGIQTFIEVKSTKNRSRSFGLSRNEYLTSVTDQTKYIVVRVFSVNSDPTIDRIFHSLPEMYEDIQGTKYYPNGIRIDYNDFHLR